MGEPGPILEIRMQSGMIDCGICGAPDEHRWGVPTFNGDLVSNEFPEWMWGPGGGNRAVCRECFEAHAAGELQTFDRYYRLPRGLCGVDLVDGGGI